MLARSHGPRLDHNAENAGPHLHHKTPARPLAGKSGQGGGAGGAPVTGGKGALMTTARTGRVLGAKDRNLGKGSDPAQDAPGLLFPAGKASTSQGPAAQALASPASRPLQQQQAFKTPLPNKAFRRVPLQDLRTPATGLRQKRAPPLQLDSPEVSVEAEAEVPEPTPEELGDIEVEYAGPSARDYDEPYVPDWDEPDYKTAGIGAALRALPFGPLGDVDEWLRHDELERRMYRATLDEEVPPPACLRDEEEGQPIFPLPKRRTPLASKSDNQASRPAAGLGRPGSSTGLGRSALGRTPLSASTSSVASPAVPPPTSRARPVLASKPSSSLPKDRVEPVSRAAISSAMGPPSATGTRKPAGSARPGASLRNVKPKWKQRSASSALSGFRMGLPAGSMSF
ncbi:hypothetical protein JCM8202v2_003804 [Rhodotorula sphaerocarpa]